MESARFRLEAEAVARIRHPNVVQVYDVGEAAGEAYMAMEFCSGGSLADRLRKHPLPPLQAARLTRAIAEGLAAAHRAHIIHRDVKPANVFLQPVRPGAADASALTADFEPKVSDFGLAKALDQDDGQTRTGIVLGTPAYMAPEQAFGHAKDLGPAADIYALGAILYECLTGRPPFRGLTAAETLDQVRTREPVPIRRLQPTVPADLETIALQCLHKEPGRRYADMIGVVEELTRFLEHRPILARPVSRSERLRRWCRRNPRVAVLSASVALLTLVITVGSIVTALWLRSERDAAREAVSRAGRAEKDRLEQLYVALMGQAHSNRYSGMVGHRETGLKNVRALRSAIPDEELTDARRIEVRDTAISCLTLSDLRERFRLDAGVDGSHGLPHSIGQDGLCPLWSPAHGGMLVRRLPDPSILRVVPTPASDENQSAFSFASPCGRWIAEYVWSTTNRLRIWRADSGGPVLDMTPAERASWVAFHPSQGEATVSFQDGILRRFSLETGRLLAESSPRGPNLVVDYLPDGKRLALTNGQGPGEILDAQSFRTLRQLDTGPAVRMHVDAAGGLLWFGTRDGRIYCWNEATGHGEFLPGREPGPIGAIRVSPDGRFLAFSVAGYTEFRTVHGNQYLYRCPGVVVGYVDGGRHVAVVNDNRLIVYECDAQAVYRAIRGNFDAATYSSDGQLLCLAGNQGVAVHEARSLALLGDLQLDRTGPVLFLPDGKEFVTFGLFSHAWRWPISADQVGRSRLGPPLPVSLSAGIGLLKGFALEPHHYGRHLASRRDGRVLAIADYRGERIWLWERDRTAEPRIFASFPSAHRIDLAPDGSLLAAASRKYRGAGAVWRLPEGKKVLDLPEALDVRFSPDGRRLACASRTHVRVYRLEDPPRLEHIWECAEAHPSHPAAIAFHPNAELLAMTAATYRTRLVELATGNTLGNLTHVHSALTRWLSFSPDGTHLAAAVDDQEVGIWDLALLRDRLAELGYACDGWPRRTARPADRMRSIEIDRGPLPGAGQWADNWKRMAMYESLSGKPSDAIDAANEALTLIPWRDAKRRAELLALRGDYRRANKDLAGARDDWEEAIRLGPVRNQTVVALCRLYLLGPEGFHQPERALRLLASLPPVESDSGPLLAYALIDAGQPREGLAKLEQHAAEGDDPLDDYFRALAHHRLGRAEVAQRYFSAGCKVHDARRPDVPGTTQDEWTRMRAMLSSLLN